MTIQLGTAASPLRKLAVAASVFLVATLIVIINFLAAPMNHAPPGANEGRVFYLAPLALGVFYICVWFVAVRQRLPHQAIVVQYKPPAGISPAEARYLYTLNCDGRTYAACAVNLAARGLVTIEAARDGVYLRTGVGLPSPERNTAPALPADIPEEERWVFHDLFHRREIALLKPPRPGLLNSIALILQERTSTAYHDFRGGVLLIGLLVMSVTTVAMAWTSGLLTRINGDTDVMMAAFLGIALFSAGMAGAFFWQHNRRAVLLAWRGLYRYRALPLLLAALLLMPGFFWLLIHRIAPLLASVTVLMLLINTFAPPFLISYTAQGRRVMRQLLGFRQFLESAEQDRLDRLSPEAENSKTHFTLLAFAIALDIRESWGDRLGAEAMIETALDRV